MKYEDIDIVLAVGGSSRMLSVQKMLKDIFGDKVQKGINPDEAVALGAAVQAGIKSEEISSENGIIVTDACNYTLGVELIGDRFSPLIYRDSKLPIRASDIYYTSHDDQTSVVVGVYQGEDPNVKNNVFVGEFELDGIPMAPEGQEKIKVTFEYDLNECLNVSAEILSTGKKESRVMSTKGLTKNQIMNLQRDTFKTTNENVVDAEITYDSNEEWKESELFERIKVSVSLAEIKLPSLSGYTKQQIENILNDMKNAVLLQDVVKLGQLDETLTDILFEI